MLSLLPARPLEVARGVALIDWTCKEVSVGGCSGEDSLMLKSDDSQYKREGAESTMEEVVVDAPWGFSGNPFYRPKTRAILGGKALSGFGEE